MAILKVKCSMHYRARVVVVPTGRERKKLKKLRRSRRRCFDNMKNLFRVKYTRSSASFNCDDDNNDDKSNNKSTSTSFSSASNKNKNKNYYQHQKHEQQQYHRHIATSKLSYHDGKNAISNLRSLWWIYCCCYLCLLSNHNSSIVNGAYSDTDELINELDRPSKYARTDVFFISSFLSFFLSVFLSVENLQ